MPHHPFRPARPGHTARAVAGAAVLALLLAACGGSDGAPTDPGGSNGGDEPPTPRTLVVGVDSARPNEFVTLRLAGLGHAVPDSVTGQVGTTPFRAARVDDSTLVGLVPAGVSGAQVVRFEVDGHSYTAQMVFRAPIEVTDPTAAATALFDQVAARFDSVEAAIAIGATNGVDTAAARRFAVAARAAAEQARARFLALTPDERRAAMPYILAEAAAVGLHVDPAATARAAAPPDFGTVARLSLANTSRIGLCTAVASFETCNQIGAAGSAIASAAREVAVCSAKTLGMGALGGTVGGAIGGILGFLAGGVSAAPGAIAGIENGAAIGLGLGLGWCVGDVWEQLTGVYDAAVKPVLVAVQRATAGGSGDPELRRAGPRATGVYASVMATETAEPDAYTVGVAQQVDVYVDFRSLSAGDASGPPALAALVEQFNQLSRDWDAIRARFSLLDAPAITLPAAPRVSVRKKVPAAYLSVAAVTPAPITAAAAGTADAWMVTFDNPQQGDDHEFSYTVRFSFTGFPDQERTLGGLLRPGRYAVAALTLTPAVDTVPVGQGTTIAWTASDSTGDVLTDSLLAGRMPAWTSAQPEVATVGATSGTVTGVSGGTASITAELEQGRATASVLSVPDITGTYTLVSENGVAIPGVTWQDSTYTIVTSGGSVTLRADGTFGYSHSATGTNAVGGATFDEGGSGGGTYTVNASGTAITFQTVEQEGVPISFGSGTILDGTLTVSVTTPDGAGSATLQKQP
jgi:hypothetical protein